MPAATNVRDLYVDWLTAHVAGSNQGGTFADIEIAVDTVLGGSRVWGLAAAELRADKYVAGFALIDGTTVEHWITVRLDDGGYVSVNLQTEEVLNGSFDQLLNDATGGPGATNRSVLNPGVDVSGFLDPFYIMSRNGSIMSGGVDMSPNMVLWESQVAAEGNKYNNSIYGNALDNIINGGAGADSMHGGTGADTYFVDDAGDQVFELDFQGGMDVVITKLSYALQTGAEIELLRTYGSATTYSVDLTGNEYNNALQGNAAANTLIGGGGVDVMHGFGGNDSYFVEQVGDLVVEGVNGGFDTVFTFIYGYALPANVEILNFWGAARTGYGNSSANWLYGNVYDETLNGGGGADWMSGAAGNDTYYVDNGADQVVETAGGGTDSVITNISYALQTGSEIELLSTYGSATTTVINLAGNEFGQTIHGNAAANTINGGGGADVLYGFAGNDTYFVDQMGDQVIEVAGGGNDTVVTNTTFQLQAGSEVELLRTYGSSTTNAINLWGNEVINTLWGNNGNNILSGGTWE